MIDRSDPERQAKRTPNPERWRRLDTLFAAALARGPEERPGFLDAQCEGEPDLRRALQSLLDSDGEAGDFLETRTFPQDASQGEDPDPGHTGTGGIIGPYRIEREIGRGGMGSVYLARRDDDAYHRQVAIKLLDRASETMVQRFRSERQILASLDHPHVARLFEGGETPAGRPYLVMEYVDGVPIDEYCDQQRLTVEQRLALFCQVCSAVHYAHQNLVVHRDIKPSNVLVNAKGEPRLLDFGIAKLLDPEAFPLTLDRTATGVRPMTPHYASPEQVRGQTITTASDVYSLGVLLFKLLTGRLPLRLKGLSVLDVEVALTETPVKASVAVMSPRTKADDTSSRRTANATPPRKGAGDTSTLAGAGDSERVDGQAWRGARPQQLARRLVGDLDNIVAMALRREPARRYGSAEQLAQDIERHLTGRPVMARRDTLRYRMTVFLRRNKMAVAVACLVLAMIIAFAASTVRQAAETARQRDRAQLERDKAKQVSDFLVDLFREVDPWEASGSDLTVREALDRGAVKIEQGLESQPEIRATIQEAIGTVYTHLGLHEQAAVHLETALATMRASSETDKLTIVGVTAKVGSLYRFQANYEGAELLYRRALEILEAGSLEDTAEAGGVHRDLANLYRVQGRFYEAQKHGEKALKLVEGVLGSEHPEVVDTLRALAGIAVRQGDPTTATEYMERALAIQRQVAGEVNLRTAAIYTNLGLLRLEVAALVEAERLLERSLAIHLRLLTEPHQRIADTLVTLANLAKAQGDDELAEERLRRALNNYERSLGGEHDLVANCLYQLGLAVLHQGRLDEAGPLLQRSFAIREKVFAADHHFLAESLRGLGELRVAEERFDEAEKLYLRALGIWEKYPRQQGTQGVPEAYATLLRAMGRDAEAAWLEERVASIGDQGFGAKAASLN